MSKFKRFLSSFLVLTMVLGMFSMLGGVFTVDASASSFTPYTTTIKSYAELEAEHPEGFFYYAAEFYEPDGTPTDHVIKPGDELTVKYYVKSSFWLTGGAFDQLFDRHVFDITNGKKKTGGRAPKPITEADGGTYFYEEGQLDNNNSTAYPTIQAIKNLNEAEIANPDYVVSDDDGGYEGDLQPAINVLAKYINFGSEYLYYNSQKSTYESLVFDLPATTDPDYDSTLKYLSQLDILRFQPATHSDVTQASQYRYTLDKYLFSITVKVKDDAPLGSTQVFLPENASFLVNNQSSVKMYIAGEPDFDNQIYDTTGAVWGSDAAAVKVTTDMVIFDLNQEFMVTADGTYSGGTTTESHSVTFMNGSAQWGDSVTVEEGGEIVAPASNPTPESGYVFAGWSTTPNGAVVTFPQTMGTADVTYYAVFTEAAKHTATFMDGSNVHASNQIAEGGSIAAPASPSKTGYNFVGWSTTSGGSANVTFPQTMGSADVTYYAVYSAKSYNVVFMNGDAQHDSGTVLFDGSYNVPADAKKTGHKFDKWVDGSGNPMPSTHTVDSDVTYYASFTPNAYKANFYTDSAKKELHESIDVVFGESITAPASPSKTGSTFMGWSTDGVNVVSSLGTMDTEGKDFIAVFDAVEAAVEFYDGNTKLDTKTGKYGDKVAAINNPQKDGYDFKGWTYDAENTQDVTWPISLGTDVVKVYAKWEAKTIWIDFVDGSEEYLYGDYNNQTYGETLVFPELDPIGGKSFIGWYDADDNPAPATVPAASTTYYAKYEDAKITVNFKADDVTTPVTGNYGESIVAPEVPAKTGYTAKGWAVEGTKTVVDFTGGKVKFSESVNYVAIYDINTYKVYYYVDDVNVNTVEYKYGATITEYVYTPTEEGKTFAGWTTSIPATMPANDLYIYGSTGTETHTITFNVNGVFYTKKDYPYNAAITAPEYEYDSNKYEFSGWDLPVTMPNNDLTVNATLTEKTYKISYYITEADYLAGKAPYATQTYTYEETITLLAAPSSDAIPAGESFLNWNCEYTAMPAKDIVVYASLSKIDYTVVFAHYDAQSPAFDTMNKHYGDIINASDLPDASREGFDFNGWKIDGTGDIVAFPYTVTGDVTFEPDYTALGYTITYKIDGKVYGEVESKNFGDAISLRPNAEKTGYEFSGWTIKVDGSPVSTMPATMPAASIEVTGSFTAIKYTATFNAGDGTFSGGKKTIEVLTDFDTVPVCPETPTLSGYAFIGWDKELAPMVVGGATYTAKYSANAVNYKIETYKMDTAGNYGTEPTTVDTKSANADSNVDVSYSVPTGFTFDADKSVVSGKVSGDGSTVFKVYLSRNQYNLTLNVDGKDPEVKAYYFEQEIPAVENPEKIGSDFVKWEPEIPATMPAKHVTATAKFNPIVYTITINTDGGTKIPDINGYYGDPVTKPSNPEKTGYAFDGWDKDFPNTIPAENMTITAKWNPNEYTITFVTGDDATQISPITKKYGEAVGTVATPTRPGYEFDKWDKVIPETMPAYSQTITAKWKVNSYDAKFIIDGNTTVVPTEFGKVPVAPSTDKLGYEFKGWEEGELVAMVVGGATYTAVYESKSYDVVFNANGGSWSGATSKSVSTKFDAAIVAPDTNPERPNFEFKGWSTDGRTVIADLGKLTTEGATFIAVWQQDLATCSVKSVTRITPNVYGKQTANYEVKVTGSPIKIEFTFVGSTVYWQYDRYDDLVGADEAEITGVYAIKAYNAQDQEVTLGSTDTAYEIWGIRAVFTEGQYKVRAKVTHSNDSWELVENAYEFTNVYDIEPANPDDFKAVASNTTVTRGDYITFTLTTSDKVNRVRLVKEETDGTLTTIAYSSDVVLDNCTVTDNNNGTLTWVIKVRFSYVGNDEEKTEAWKFQYRKADGEKWVDSSYSYNIKITKYAEVESPVAGVDPYSVISVTAPDGVKKGAYGEFTVVTTADVSRVRLTVNGKSTSYLTTSKNVTKCDVNGDGTMTWTIKYKLNTAGNLDVSAQARGNKWSAAVDTTCTVA